MVVGSTAYIGPLVVCLVLFIFLMRLLHIRRTREIALEARRTVQIIQAGDAAAAQRRTRTHAHRTRRSGQGGRDNPLAEDPEGRREDPEVDIELPRYERGGFREDEEMVVGMLPTVPPPAYKGGQEQVNVVPVTETSTSQMNVTTPG
ncbi:hypothetical protein SAICODRAFT_108182 [Saitoella complicata NRRL Y-17804]|uniref:uncharacterized protein n=1 Tax=Saitoella complicata (strain BCRC 22490 / CBS 7301 / JCM 7358 / NBRC 10748 / NRRL Y-17804) TaxID=698492 RepID=UPI000867CF3F|nr:uncharacterized protein SAICODRAFT_108182 [Saitoella complicata NRRL Y-17804]ODQ56418.1 hypothetical protein SAICODRAFT_108182 [Saitoella complicata NRRL Y-17804]